MSDRIARRRAGALLAFVLIGLVALGLRLGQVQVVRADSYTDVALAQRLRKIDLPPARGTIYDRRGGELAVSVPARTIYANPRQIRDPAHVARKLAEVLETDAVALEEKLRRDKGFVYIARRVDVGTAERIQSLGLIGIGMLDEASRTYPAGSLGALVVGFVGTDAEGLAGVEYAYEDLLSGEPGWRLLELDPSGRRIPQGEFRERAPVAGADLVLTLDRDLQYAADRALAQAVEDTGADGGTIVALDPRTGDILAMAARPLYDPNDPSSFEPGEMRNRAVTDVFEPGSVNKLVTAAGALAEGTATPDSVYNVPYQMRVGGYTFSDAHGHATQDMTFSEVIADSSNIGTIKVALQLGGDNLTKWMRRFGYGRSTALGFPGESAGIVPPADRWGTSLPTMAIGQGVSVTALQLVRAFGAVANDGVMVEPRLLRGWVDTEGQLHSAAPGRSERVVSPAVAEAMRDILTRAVVDGTGALASVPGYSVAGKTGTAQKVRPGGGYQGYMSSFYGFLPAGRPELVIGVTLDDPSPYYGGVVAAPVFKEVASSAARILRMQPEVDPAVPEESAPAGD